MLSISPSQRLQQDNQGAVAVQLPFISRLLAGILSQASQGDTCRHNPP